MDPSKDCKNYKHINNPKARESVDAMMQCLDLVDIWRELNSDIRRYTWTRKRPRKQARLDYFLISDSATSFVKEANILSGYKSDHSMITLTLALSQNKPHRSSYWKFNTSLLHDWKYAEIINKVIKDVTFEYSSNDLPFEEFCKLPISQVSLTISDEVLLDFLLM
jgi:hypothetical protein